MSLTQVMVTEAVASDCFLHALTTEREEVMGLLLGDIQILPPLPGQTYPGGITDVSQISREQATKMQGVRKVARVWGCRVLHRSDKRPDRVEIPPERMCDVTDEAEELTKKTGQLTRVVGWYHSHPHITPYPSHVDLATQGMYQFIETGWVGLIFSVFHSDKKKCHGRMELHSFQTHVTAAGSNEHIKVPVGICRSDVLLPQEVTNHFAPLSQTPVLTQALISEHDENLDKALSHPALFGAMITSSTGDAEPATPGTTKNQQAELRAILRSVYQQQLFSTKQIFLIPTLETANLFRAALENRVEGQRKEIQALETEEAELMETFARLEKEEQTRLKGIDAFFE